VASRDAGLGALFYENTLQIKVHYLDIQDAGGLARIGSSEALIRVVVAPRKRLSHVDVAVVSYWTLLIMKIVRLAGTCYLVCICSHLKRGDVTITAIYWSDVSFSLHSHGHSFWFENKLEIMCQV
jgi:hypothetical protein